MTKLVDINFNISRKYYVGEKIKMEFSIQL